MPISSSFPQTVRNLCVFLSLSVVSASRIAFAQAQDSSVAERLGALETSVRSLGQQVGELTSLLKLALPAPPIEDVVPFAIPLGEFATKGADSAQLVLIEYSDFQCPFCGRNFHTTFREVQRQLVDTGLVRYQFRNLPVETIHPFAFRAAQAAECARDQHKFWEMHERLFDNQQALGDADLMKYAQALSVDQMAFRSCLADVRIADKIRADLDDARRFGITGTPTFLVGKLEGNKTVRVVKRIVGSQPIQVFKIAIQSLTP